MPRSSSVRMLTGTSARSSMPPVLHAAGGEPAAQRAGDDREHDVVDGAAEGVLDLPEVVEVRVHPPVPAVRPDLRVERHVRRRVHQLPRDLAEPLGHLERVRGGLARVLRRLQHAPAEPQRHLGDVLDARARAGAASLGSGCGFPRPHRAASARPGTGLASKSTVARSTPETPSTSAWCVLLIDREAVVLEALHEPHLPQRLGAVELLGEHASR